MTRSILSGMLGLMSVLAVGSLPLACQSGGVGDPCVPEDEYNTDFAGFKVTEENIESRSFQCQTRICLVNHFQGRVSCPFGQDSPPPAFDKKVGGQDMDSTTDTVEVEENGVKVEKKMPCVVPGTETPINVEVCGQCSATSKRDAAQAVYCSCRCGIAEGQKADENFNFCECPTGYVCEQIRPYVGLGDPLLAGKYCIKEGTKFENEGTCGTVKGNFDATQCKGVPGGGT